MPNEKTPVQFRRLTGEARGNSDCSLSVLSKAAMIVDISNIIKTETSSGGELSEHHTGSSLQIREAFLIYLYIYRTDRGSYREMMN